MPSRLSNNSFGKYLRQNDQDKSFISVSTSFIVLKACSTMRKRSLPDGTVGYNIGLMSKPASCSLNAVCFTLSLPGIITICMGVAEINFSNL